MTTGHKSDKDSRMAELEALKITKAKFPNVEVQARVDKLTNLIETEAPKWKLETTLDELVATIKEKNRIGCRFQKQRS